MGYTGDDVQRFVQPPKREPTRREIRDNLRKQAPREIRRALFGRWRRRT